MDRQPNIWDGTSLGQGPISLFLCGSSSEVEDRPSEVMFGGASNGAVSVGVVREHLAGFVKQHDQATFVCYDAAAFHWLIHDYFQEIHDEDASWLLWEYSGDCRLIDLGLLDQQVRRIETSDVLPERATLARLA